jgi:RNA polymerase sigma factor (TIGR02999 family)
MAQRDRQDTSGLVAAWGSGDQAALRDLIPVVYPELRRIARQHLRRWNGGQTFESAALANEVYLKLVRVGGIACESRLHFLALCSQMIRRILVDHGRRRASAKHGGEEHRAPLDQALGVSAPRIDILALNEALERLSQIDPRKSQVVELRYFGGLTTVETAEVLEISEETAKRDWRMAKAWLLETLTNEP